MVLSGRAGGDPELSYCICYEGEEDHYTKPVAAEYARRNADHFSYLSGKRKFCKTYVTQNAQITFEQQFFLIPRKSSVSCHVKVNTEYGLLLQKLSLFLAQLIQHYGFDVSFSAFLTFLFWIQ